MRKAAVPIKVMTFNNDDKLAVLEGVVGALCKNYKLTKEDIETLVRVYEEFRPDTWKDKSECMVLAIKSVGFEVED
jgi:hypothetical protein